MTKNKKITFRIEEVQKNKILKIAKLQDKTISCILQEIIQNFLKEQEK